MVFLVDLIIIAIILLFTFIGYKRGLIKIAFGLCTFIIALIVATVLYKPVSSFVINNTEIDEKIQETITEKILPEGLSETTEIELDEDVSNILIKNGVTTIQDISVTFSTKIIETVVLLAIFILAKIILKFVTILADAVAKLPILNQFNKTGGILFGFLHGLFIVLIIFTLISLFEPMIDSSVITNIQDSKIGSMIYNNNIVLHYIAR